MNWSDLYLLIPVALAIAGIISLAQLLHKRAGVPAIHTRKLIHLGVGLLILSEPVQIVDHRVVLISTLFFVSFLLWIRSRNQLTALGPQRLTSLGDVLFPIAIYINFLFYQFHQYHRIFFLPLLVLTISDPLAFYAGYLFKTRGKSLVGAAAFFLSSLIFSVLLLDHHLKAPVSHLIPLSLACALSSTLAEYYTPKGMDNLSIPLSIIAVLIVYLQWFS